MSKKQVQSTGKSIDVQVPNPAVRRSPAQILDDLVARNLEGFVKPYKVVRTELGHFQAINNRFGSFAYVVADKNGKEFKLGKAQAKRLGIKVPGKGECDELNRAYHAKKK